MLSCRHRGNQSRATEVIVSFGSLAELELAPSLKCMPYRSLRADCAAAEHADESVAVCPSDFSAESMKKTCYIIEASVDFFTNLA